MRLRELPNGVQISAELRLDSPLYTHNGIAQYLASDSELGHALLHIMPDFEENSLETLERVVSFYEEVLNVKARCGRYEEFLYFSEPFPLGEYMFEWLERRERVSLPDAIKRIISLLKTLDNAHSRGIYHGRITPQTVLLERSGEAFGLRMLGLGIAQSLTPSMKCDIDWFDYTFDLEGMTPAAVDIYGLAIILMGLVSGESGIDSFESTGLLPQALRGGILQQAMERALALRIDAYSNVLAFSLDLEAALLELDDRQGEVYVGDLVGFESAVRSITSISEEPGQTENSGIWSSMFDTLEQEERSSLLCSLTSLTAIKPVDEDEDDDVTRITSLPKSVLSLQRIKSAHLHEEDEGVTSVLSSLNVDETGTTVSAPDDGEEITGNLSAAAKEGFANLLSMEAELETDSEEDDSPTRVMMRPTYESITVVPEPKPEEVPGIEEATESIEADENPIAAMEKRIRNSEVTESDFELGHDVLYDENDPIAFPPCEEPEPAPAAVQNDGLVKNAAQAAPAKDASASQNVKKKKKRKFSKKQQTILLLLIIVVIILIAIVGASFLNRG